MKQLKDCSREELLGLLEDAAKNWLAHDGLWFQQVEQALGLDKAIEMDTACWSKFSVIEAERIMKRHNIKPGGGIPALRCSRTERPASEGIGALVQALGFRLYAYINKQEVIEVTDKRCVFRMNACRVQETRQRKNLPAFSCKSVGIVEYANFAKTIDSRIKTRCITCPPDACNKEYWCAWEFNIS